jgi:hypothetical protein
MYGKKKSSIVHTLYNTKYAIIAGFSFLNNTPPPPPMQQANFSSCFLFAPVKLIHHLSLMDRQPACRTNLMLPVCQIQITQKTSSLPKIIHQENT